MSSAELPLRKPVMKSAAERLLQSPGKTVFGFLQQDRESEARLQGLAEQLDSQLLQVPGIEGLAAEPLTSSVAEKLQRHNPPQQSEAVQESIEQPDRERTDETLILQRKPSSSSDAPAVPGGGKSAIRKTIDGANQDKRDKLADRHNIAGRDSKKSQAQKRMSPTVKTAATNQLHFDKAKPRQDNQSKPAIASIARKQNIDAEHARKRLAARAEQAGVATAWRTPVTSLSTRPLQSEVKDSDENRQGFGASNLEQQIENYMQKVAPKLKRPQGMPSATDIKTSADTRNIKADEKIGKTGVKQNPARRTTPSMEPAPVKAAGIREPGVGIGPKVQAVGGLRGLAALASGPLGLPEAPRQGDEAIAQQSTSAEPPLSPQSGAQQKAQPTNVLPSPSQATPVPGANAAGASDNTSAVTQHSLAADITEVLVEEARRAGIDVEQFRP